ncbi:MAG: hypothetical protein RL291_1990, partial [Pseudomonadota bacterium]
GFVLIALRFGGRVTTPVDAIEYLSTKIGLVVLIIGMMHFFNMSALVRYRKSRLFDIIDRNGHALPTSVPPHAAPVIDPRLAPAHS